MYMYMYIPCVCIYIHVHEGEVLWQTKSVWLKRSLDLHTCMDSPSKHTQTELHKSNIKACLTVCNSLVY